MAESETSSPDELRRDVRTALKSTRMDSFREACKFVVGLAGVCALVGGGLVQLQKFSSAWLTAFIIITIAGGIVAYAIMELTRLQGHSVLLRRLLDSEKYYESLLRVAREEKQVAEDTARRIQTRLDVLLGVRDFIARSEHTPSAETQPGAREENG